MACTALSYAERVIVGRGLSVTTMVVVTLLCIRYSAIWRLGMGLRYGEVWGRTPRFEGPNLEIYCKGHSIRKLWLGSLNWLTLGRLGTLGWYTGLVHLSGPMQGSHSWHADHSFNVWSGIMPQTENRQKDFDAHCMNM